MDYHMKSFLVNCVAFEQLHNRRTEQLHKTKQFTVYARFLDGLVNTTNDVNTTIGLTSSVSEHEKQG
jgi:methyltransferase-like protein